MKAYSSQNIIINVSIILQDPKQRSGAVITFANQPICPLPIQIIVLVCRGDMQTQPHRPVVTKTINLKVLLTNTLQHAINGWAGENTLSPNYAESNWALWTFLVCIFFFKKGWPCLVFVSYISPPSTLPNIRSTQHICNGWSCVRQSWDT